MEQELKRKTTDRMSRTIAFTDTAPPIPTDSVALARGRYLATAIAKCAECHGDVADLRAKVKKSLEDHQKDVAYDDLRGHLEGGVAAWEAAGLPVNQTPVVSAAAL